MLKSISLEKTIELHLYFFYIVVEWLKLLFDVAIASHKETEIDEKPSSTPAFLVLSNRDSQRDSECSFAVPSKIWRGGKPKEP